MKILFFSLLMGGVAGASPLAQAQKALDEGLPQIALAKLAHVNASEADTREVELCRARVYLALGDTESALRHLPEDAPAQLRLKLALARQAWADVLALTEVTAPETLLHRIDALEQLGRRDEAITLLKGEAALPCQLRLAELYLAAGESESTEALLKEIEPEGIAQKNWKGLLEGRLYLAQNKPAYTIDLLSSLPSADCPPPLALSILLTVADAHLRLDDPEGAEEKLERFLWDHPSAAVMGEVFAKLDEAYANDSDPSYTTLERMAERDPRLRAGYALYYRARGMERVGRTDRALKLLQTFAESYPQHPVRSEALLGRGRLLIAAENYPEALASLEEASRSARGEALLAQIELATATIHFHTGEYLLAATLFRSAGERNPALWAEATYRAALCWLALGNFARAHEDYLLLREKAPKFLPSQALRLEHARALARRDEAGRDKARDMAEEFLSLYPKSARTGEAHLLLAELRFASNDAEGAAHQLKATNRSGASAEADFLAIFVADAKSGREDAAVIALGRRFLADHPEAPQRWQVRMKLGEIAFAQGDFAGAQNEFETVGHGAEDRSLAEAALYLAGQAAMKSMSGNAMERALDLFEEVTKIGGPLRFHARLQQAAVKNQADEPKQALVIYDAILEAEPPKEIRFAALAGKANNLFEQNDATAQEEALKLYLTIAQEAGDDPLWRTQALYLAARTRQTLQRPEEALATYYDTLEAGAGHPEAVYWYYKAGFDAGRLYEKLGKWEDAIAIYRKIARTDGPRSEEARARMARLQLEHFIWE